MNQKEFNKKYKGIKMYKYVPLLETEVKKQMGRVADWTEAALDAKEENTVNVYPIRIDREYLYGIILFLLIVFLIFFNLNVLKIFA